MPTTTAALPRLRALIGDVAHDVPADIAREIECALAEQLHPPARPTFISCLDAIRKGVGEDSQPCTAQALDAQTLASLGRSLAALTTVLDLLHASERTRVEADLDQQLGDFHTDGLILAARQIAHAAQASLGDAVAPASRTPG